MKFVPCWNMEMLFLVGTFIYLLGYHNISYLINASIYLVKGGRLGLMPGVGVKTGGSRVGGPELCV